MNENSSLTVRGRPLARSEADRLRLQRMFAIYHRTVWRILRRRGFTPDAAADVTQRAFLIAAERLADIEPGSERAFLIATALRAAWGFRKKASRTELDDDLGQLVSSAADERVEVKLCDLALSKVEPEFVEVFLLYEIEGLSSTEIATLLEIPMASVASRLRSAREQFRAAVNRLERGVLRGAQA
jgi:RNA polymerase sigma-70 factor (ECF subfamily)